MAEERKKRRLKQPETVRESQRSTAKKTEKKPRRLRTATDRLKKPVRKATSFGRREYYLPLPDNKLGRFFNKRRSIMPKFFREAWTEVRQVSWPGTRETARMTIAVIIFAMIFGGLIAIVDYGLDIIFRRILL
jgi:preprotein translocase SecE subunit